MKTKLQMPKGTLRDARAVKLLFGLCWAAYFTTYLGRLNYAACLVEITNTEGWTKGQAGLIATGFFAAYGCGQLVNGFVGDKLSPKIMVALGLGASGAINLIFPLLPNAGLATAVWCVNGFVQSMVWSPLVRLIAEWMPMENRLKACVNLNSTVPVGTLVTYGLSAVLVYLGNWKLVFYISGICLLVMTAFWLWELQRLENQLDPVVKEQTGDVLEVTKHASIWKLALASAVPLCCIALMMQGVLKDGVTTWIPTFLEERFDLTAAAAILSTTVVPIVNLGGVYLASWINKKCFHNELVTASVFFATGGIALALLVFFPNSSAVFSLLLLALTTTFMMGINTLLVSMMPAYYARYGVCSSMSGILNASAYIGSALSSYGNGAVVERFGWNSIMYIWCICAAIGVLVCAFAMKRWHRFSSTAIKTE